MSAAEPDSLRRTAASATLHCLTGCAIGEVLGLIIGEARGWESVPTIALSVVLAFVFGYSLSLLPLVRAGVALSAATQLALFVGPFLVLVSYVIAPAPMDLRFWMSAVVMMLIAALSVALVTNSGRSTWFVGVLLLMIYFIFAASLYLMPPQVR